MDNNNIENNDLQKENQILQEQVKMLVQQLKEKENNKCDYTNRNDQSSFFSTFKQNTPRGGMSRDQSKRDLQDMGATIKRLNEEKELLRKTLKNQTDAFNQKIQLREDDLIQKEKLFRALQVEYKSLIQENDKLKQQLQQFQSSSSNQESTLEQSQKNSIVPQQITTDNIYQFRVMKMGLSSMPAQIIIRKSLFDTFIIELETSKDRTVIQLTDITDLVPDRQKEDNFQISYKIMGQKFTEYFASKEYKQILKLIKYLHQQQAANSPRKSEVPVQSGGLIKSLSSFFLKK